ncbi:XRE family transcriptional regulator [Trichlorobacter thiogenes]|nr:XRE family transcriptional regulator [Trichlorobacter thiogenes]
MDYETFKGYVRKSGLELKEFAGLIGMNHKSVSNYSKLGEVPKHVAIIVFMMVELGRLDVDIMVLFAKLEKTEQQVRKQRKNASRMKPLCGQKIINV